MVIDHIGIVVRALEDGVRQWEESFGYRQKTGIVFNQRQMVRVVFLAKAGSLTIKLIEPAGAESPVRAFANRGGGLHHICFRCGDMSGEIPLLTSKGARLIVPPQPGEAFADNDIAFLLAANNLNIELIDTTEKAGWADC